MTYTWNQAFESFPPGSYRGNTMGEGVRRIKAAFYERFIVNHIITESATPTVLHKLGMCSILAHIPNDETPLSNYVEGALQFTTPGLKYDNGSALEDVVPKDHGIYTLLDADDHPQYIKIAGDTLNVNISVERIVNLSTDVTDYDSSSDNVMSADGHKNPSASGISTHGVAIFSESRVDAMTNKDGLKLASGKWQFNDYSYSFDGSTEYTYRIHIVEDIMTVPFLSSVSGAGYFEIKNSTESSARVNNFRMSRENDISATISYKGLR